MNDKVTPRRSVLYVPGGNARMHEKARGVAADGIVIDLEDSVAPDAKGAARDLAAATVQAGGFGLRTVAIRVNGPGTLWFEEDLRAAARAQPHAVLITKAETADQIHRAASLLADAPNVRIWAMIETPRGILNCAAIAASVGRLAGLIVGTNDIIKDIGARPRPDRMAVLGHLAHVILVARAHGLFVLDGVFNDFSNAAGFEAECEQGRDLGFDGKTLIHPSQIEAANRIFTPPAEEVAQARRIIEAFSLPENAGKGAISLDGRMVELLHAESARRMLALAEAISARQGG